MFFKNENERICGLEEKIEVLYLIQTLKIRISGAKPVF